MFIKLTQRQASPTSQFRTIFLNADRVEMFHAVPEGTNLFVAGDESPYKVAESVDQVLALVQQQPPRILNRPAGAQSSSPF